MKNCHIVFDNELYHYGVKGMKWGVRRDYVPKGRRRSTKAKINRIKKKWNGLSDKQKRYIKIGAGVTMAALAIGGGAYLYKTGRFTRLKNIGETAVKGQFGKGFDSLEVNKKSLGKTLKDSDKPFVKTINADNIGTSGGKNNCFHTSLAYITNSLFGKTCSALPYNNVDELSGAVITGGRHVDLYEAIFSGINRQTFNSGTLGDNLDKIPNNSTGIIFISNKINGAGHFFNYERTKNGMLTFIDTQPDGGLIVDGNTSVFNQFELNDILDFSNAKFKKDSGKILKYILK